MRVFTWVRVFLNVLEAAGVLDPSVVLHIRAVRVCEPFAAPAAAPRCAPAADAQPLLMHSRCTAAAPAAAPPLLPSWR